MKRTFFTLTLLVGSLLPLAPRAQAATEVSLNFFYDNLSSEGNWIDVGDYGYCFQPNVAVSDAGWRPYADGYWAYTDAGWTWVSYEDFGWATYHYGRWTNLDDYGWIWVPGTEWGPAWVSWRTGGDYVGWAPLPPAAEPVYEGRAITGHVDVEFDIGPAYYNFVDVRYIGEPVLRQRLVEPVRNVTIINNTVNVTNITYNNSTVRNYGPNFEQVNRYSVRPVQRMQLQRETTVANLDVQSGGRRNFNQVNGNQLRVVAPPIQKPTQKIAPKQVKATVKTPKIEHGWKNIANREQLQAQMKKEDSRNVPPPTVQPQGGRKAGAATNEQNVARPNDKDNAAERKNQQAERGARQARRAEKADENKKNENSPIDHSAERKAARAERAQAAEASKIDDSQKQADQAGHRAAQHENQKQQNDQAHQSAAHKVARENAQKTNADNDDQQERTRQQQERANAHQEKHAEQQPDGNQPHQARAHQQERAANASQPAQHVDQHHHAQAQPAAHEEHAQPQEAKQQHKKQKGPHDKKPDQPEP